MYSYWKRNENEIETRDEKWEIENEKLKTRDVLSLKFLFISI